MSCFNFCFLSIFIQGYAQEYLSLVGMCGRVMQVLGEGSHGWGLPSLLEIFYKWSMLRWQMVLSYSYSVPSIQPYFGNGKKFVQWIIKRSAGRKHLKQCLCGVAFRTAGCIYPPPSGVSTSLFMYQYCQKTVDLGKVVLRASWFRCKLQFCSIWFIHKYSR